MVEKNTNEDIRIDGGRHTPVREAICCFFKRQQEPADYAQIKDFLDNLDLTVNKTTVYRQLDFLLFRDIIQELDFGEGKKRYELTRDHHHHLLCTECGKIECVHIDEDFRAQEEEILKSKGFEVTDHTLEFRGVCKHCRRTE